MTRVQWGALIWLGIFLPVFLALELPAKLWKGCPWPTLSEFTWEGIQWWHVVGAVVAVFMLVLLGHFEWQWKVRWVIAAAVLGALAISLHLLIREAIG